MRNYKIIQDPIHGSIRIDGVFLDLIQTPEMQRLYGIRQLGPTYLVYPGANHTRFEHCLGAYHTAKRLGGALDLTEHERKLIKAVALLHDIGHGPFSHTLENVYHYVFGIDHKRVSSEVILGEYDMFPEEERKETGFPSIPKILERDGLRPKEIAMMVNRLPKKRYLGQIIHGGIDVDKIDYLLRDAHYTGAVHGVIDLSRLLEVLEIHDDRLVISKKGITSIEEMLIGRSLMFISVYLHKTVRIIENMMSRAVEESLHEMGDFQRMNDSDFMQFLLSRKGYSGEIARMIKYRKIFKSVYSLRVSDTDADRRDFLVKIGRNMKTRREFENHVCDSLGIPEGSVIADIPFTDTSIRNEMKYYYDNLRVLDRGELHSLERFTPIISYLKGRHIPEWSIMVSAHPKYSEKVKSSIEKLIW